MKNFTIAFLLLFCATAVAQSGRKGKGGQPNANSTAVWEVSEGTEDNMLHVMADARAEALVKKYKAKNKNSRKQAYRAYKKYLLAEHRNRGKAQGVRKQLRDESLAELKTELQAVCRKKIKGPVIE